MNMIWGVMILAGMAYGMITGRVDAVSDAVLSSAKEAITLCITMLGVLAFWMGLMEIAQAAGIIRFLSAKIRPLIRFLFPHIPEGHPAAEHITMNCVANVLGLGWAATPAGLKAMEALAQLEEERREAETEVRKEKAGDRRQRKKSGRTLHIPSMPRGIASNEMCTFLIINISSLQLIPVNVIAYRTQYGSANPNVIVAPGIVATLISTLVAVAFCKVMDRKRF